jgi:hypothetical protein
MDATTTHERIDPDQIAVDVSRIADTLRYDRDAELPREAAYGEVFNALTDLDLKVSEARERLSEGAVWYADSRVLVQRDALQHWESPPENMDGHAVIPVEGDDGGVIVVNLDYVYEAVDLAL